MSIEKKISLPQLIARGTVVMLPESPQSQDVQKVEPVEDPVSVTPLLAKPENLEKFMPLPEHILLTCVEDTSPKEPILEKAKPTTNPTDFDTTHPEKSIDKKLPCDVESIPSVETLAAEVSSEDFDKAFFDSLLD
ncbi:unnamed protein product [Cuscuta campestris]|uniref:Uncharacterized protein n=1 Tax=Cuscuta campestris TaxID=132261 RepID=A0A484KAX2_9ASTE|nr:unnamed protein product [Cuscuta campestris]